MRRTPTVSIRDMPWLDGCPQTKLSGEPSPYSKVEPEVPIPIDSTNRSYKLRFFLATSIHSYAYPPFFGGVPALFRVSPMVIFQRCPSPYQNSPCHVD